MGVIFFSVLSLVGFPTMGLSGELPDIETAQDTINLARLTTEYLQAVEAKKDPPYKIEIIKKILKLDPGSVTFWFYLGVQQKMIYEFNAAVDAFSKSLDLSSESSARPIVQIYDYLGYCFHTLGYYKEELEVYDAGMVHYPEHPALIGRKAICYYALGKIRSADQLLSAFQSYWEDIGRSESEILYSLGKLFIETDDVKAERFFRSALQTDPENIEIQASLAKVLISMGVRMEEAMDILEKALKFDPEDPVLLHLYGWGYFRLEQYSLAYDYLFRAEELYPYYNHNLNLHLDKSVEILSIKLDRPEDR